MKVNGWRTLTATLSGARDFGVAALGATNKMFWSEHHREVMELALDIVGMDAQILGGDGDDESWPGVMRQRGRDGYSVSPMQASFFFSRSETIWGGTAEIQRNIVGERVLGLPREPRVEDSDLIVAAQCAARVREAPIVERSDPSRSKRCGERRGRARYLHPANVGLVFARDGGRKAGL